MRRDIKKSFWVNSEEDYEIKMKAQAACLSEAEFFRQLCRGYTPVSKPDERFWQAMDLMRELKCFLQMRKKLLQRLKRMIRKMMNSK